MLKRKMLRDMLEYKVQFISIFLMAFIGVLVFSGLYVDTVSFETTIDNYYGETNLADGWIYSEYLVDEFLYQVDVLGATTQMERQLVVESQAKLDKKPDIMLHFVENNTISRLYLIEGKEFDLNDSEGVWLDKSFADARHLKIGDEISFESNGIEINKEIRGLVYSPEYVYNMPISVVLDHNSTGFAYMSYKAFPSDNMSYNVLNVRFKGTPETFSKLLAYRLEGYYTTFLKRSNQHSVDIIEDAISQQKSIASIFPTIFIIISMLMLLTTMNRIITHQRTQIGVLKANGFGNKAIAFHYLWPGFIMVTLGSILGAVLGPIIFHMIANPSRMFYYKFPYWIYNGFIDSAILIPFIGAISLLVSYFSIRDIVNESASSIMKPKVPKESTSSFVEKLGIWNMLSFNFRWNYRNIKRNKFRSIMTIFGVIGCTILLISGLGLYDGINESKEWYFNDINHFESKLIIDGNASSSQVNSIVEKVNGDSIMESSVQILSNDAELAPLLILNGTDLLTITDSNRDRIEIGPDEVSISQKLAEGLDINVGDIIEFRVIGSNEDIKVKIDKIHSSPFSQGLVTSPEKLEELGLNYTPTSILSSRHINESYDGINYIIYSDDIFNSWNQMFEIQMIIVFALIFFAVFLALVILYNLNMLSFTEMENDIATLKILGFERGYLIRILAMQSLFFIISGFLVGIPISYYVLSTVMPAFGKNIYLIPSISLRNLFVTFTIIMAVSIIMNVYFSRKIKDLEMVESIKSLEV